MPQPSDVWPLLRPETGALRLSRSGLDEAAATLQLRLLVGRLPSHTHLKQNHRTCREIERQKVTSLEHSDGPGPGEESTLPSPLTRHSPPGRGRKRSAALDVEPSRGRLEGSMPMGGQRRGRSCAAPSLMRGNVLSPLSQAGTIQTECARLGRSNVLTPEGRTCSEKPRTVFPFH